MSKGIKEKDASEDLSASAAATESGASVSDKDTLFTELIECIDEIAAERDDALGEITRLTALVEVREADLVALEAEETAPVDELPDQRVIALQTEVGTLKDYIEGRKATWEAQERQANDYKDALTGMQAMLEKKDSEQGDQRTAKEELEKSIADLQKECAALDGRRGERELDNRDLNDRLAAKVKEFEAKSLELAEAGESRQKAVLLAAEREKEIATLERTNASYRDKLAEFECALEEVTRTSAEEIEKTRRDIDGHADDSRLETEELKKELAGYKQALTREQEQAKALQGEFREARHELARLSKAKSAMEMKLEVESDKTESNSSELRKMIETRDALQEELDGLTASSNAQLVTKSAVVTELEAELAAQKDTVRLLKADAEALGRRLGNVESLEAHASDGSDTESETSQEMAISRLMVVISGMPSVKFPIYKPVMSIGRSGESDIQVNQQAISRAHAQLVEHDNRIRLEDLDSKNGVSVNGQRVASQSLQDGDIVSIGTVKFRFIDQATAKVNAA